MTSDHFRAIIVGYVLSVTVVIWLALGLPLVPRRLANKLYDWAQEFDDWTKLDPDEATPGV